MEHRKNLNKDLRRQSGLFFQIGLLTALMLCVSAFEYRTVIEENPVDISKAILEDEWLPPITDIKDPPPPPPKPKLAIPVEAVESVEEIPEEVTFDPSIIEVPPVEFIEEAPPVETAEEDWVFVETMPEPVGGTEAFYAYINKNLRYPNQARKLGVEGKVYVEFVVSKTGKLERFKIIKGIGSGCDEEVLRVMKNAPDWNPGKQRGVPVNVKRTLPIFFRLD